MQGVVDAGEAIGDRRPGSKRRNPVRVRIWNITETSNLIRILIFQEYQIVPEYTGNCLKIVCNAAAKKMLQMNAHVVDPVNLNSQLVAINLFIRLILWSIKTIDYNLKQALRYHLQFSPGIGAAGCVSVCASETTAWWKFNPGRLVKLQKLDGSFSAVSKPIFASKYSLVTRCSAKWVFGSVIENEKMY